MFIGTSRQGHWKNNNVDCVNFISKTDFISRAATLVLVYVCKSGYNCLLTQNG